MTTPNVDGIDISHWNVITDESAIPHYPLMSCKATEGRTAVSKTFAQYWAMFARLEARYRGAYHWVRSDSPMRAQVDNLAKRLDAVGGLQPGDFVQLDWETTANIPNVTVAQIDEWIELAHERWGERVIVYGAPWVPGFTTWRAHNPDFPIWLANYNTGDGPKSGWRVSETLRADVWQWSSTYKVPGFLWNPDNPTDGIDVNHVFNWATLDRLCLRPGGGSPTEPVEELPPPPIVVTPGSDEEEDSMKIKVMPEDVWFEKVGVDLRRVGSGNEYAGLPGAEVTLNVDEMTRLVATCRYTYGIVEPAQLGGPFAAVWLAKREPAPINGGTVYTSGSGYTGTISLTPKTG